MPTKAYLALKGTNNNLESCFMLNPALKVQYKVGERTTTKHKDFPLFILGREDIVSETHASTGGGHTKLLLISVLAKDMNGQLLFSANGVCYNLSESIERIREEAKKINEFHSAMSVRVLEEIPSGTNLFEFLQAKAKQYKMKVLK